MKPNKLLRRLQAVGAIAALAFAVAGLAAFTDRPASAQPTSYTMTAAANEASFEIDAASFPLLAPQAAYFSPGTAQAELDSFGGSTAFAGAPFLGQTIEGVGGLANGLGAGTLPPLPVNLPGYVSTDSPSNPTAKESQGPYTLTSNSTQNSSTATAGIGLVSGQPQLLATSATATTTLNPDGSLQATAQAVLQPFAIGSVLQLGTVQATATMTIDANGKLTKTSSLDLGSFTIAGIKIGVTQNGFQILDGLLPIPSSGALNTLLAPLGLQINFLPSSQTATSVTSAGLQIAEKQTVPIEGASAIVITVGQATATLQSGTAPPSTVAPTINGDTPSGVTPIPSATGDDTSTLGTPSDTTPIQTAGPSDASTPAASTPAASTPAAIRINGQLGPDAIRWYGILALAALALTLASRLAGAIAIRRGRGRT
jgi:hypothetical protein